MAWRAGWKHSARLATQHEMRQEGAPFSSCRHAANASLSPSAHQVSKMNMTDTAFNHMHMRQHALSATAAFQQQFYSLHHIDDSFLT
jgi:hypothetical protein